MHQVLNVNFLLIFRLLIGSQDSGQLQQETNALEPTCNNDFVNYR
jgi:hypothetical protein